MWWGWLTQELETHSIYINNNVYLIVLWKIFVDSWWDVSWLEIIRGNLQKCKISDIYYNIYVYKCGISGQNNLINYLVRFIFLLILESIILIDQL